MEPLILPGPPQRGSREQVARSGVVEPAWGVYAARHPFHHQGQSEGKGEPAVRHWMRPNLYWVHEVQNLGI